MDLTQEQIDNLRFKHLQATLLERFQSNTIYSDPIQNYIAKGFDDILNKSRESIINAKDDQEILKVLSDTDNKVNDYLNPDSHNNPMVKAYLNEYQQVIEHYKLDSDKQPAHLLFSDKAVSGALDIHFQRFDTLQLTSDEISEINSEFDDKLQMYKVDSEIQLEQMRNGFIDTEVKSNKYEATSIQTILSDDISEIDKKTQSIYHRDNYENFRKTSQRLIDRYNLNSINLNLSNLDNKELRQIENTLNATLSGATEDLGLTDKGFSPNRTLSLHIDEKTSNLGEYYKDSNKFVLNGNDLRNLSRQIHDFNFSPNEEKTQEIQRLFNQGKTTVVHEWAHFADDMILRKIQKEQVANGFEPQAASSQSIDGVKRFASEVTTPFYGLSAETSQSVQKASDGLKSILRDLNGSPQNKWENFETTGNMISETFWRDNTSLGENYNSLSDLEKQQLNSRANLDIIIANINNPDSEKHQKALDNMLTANNSQLNDERLFQRIHNSEFNMYDLKKEDEPVALLKSLHDFHQGITPEDDLKSSVLKNAEHLDNSYQRKYYSNPTEIIARSSESNFSPNSIEKDDMLYPDFSQEQSQSFRNNMQRIVGATMGEENLSLKTRFSLHIDEYLQGEINAGPRPFNPEKIMLAKAAEIKTGLEEKVDDLKSRVSEVGNKFVEGVSEFGQKIQETFNDGISDVKNKFATFGKKSSQFIQSASETFNSHQNYIRNMIEIPDKPIPENTQDVNVDVEPGTLKINRELIHNNKQNHLLLEQQNQHKRQHLPTPYDDLNDPYGRR